MPTLIINNRYSGQIISATHGSRARSRHGNADPAYVNPVSGMAIIGRADAVKKSYSHYQVLGASPHVMLVAAMAQRWHVGVSTLHAEKERSSAPVANSPVCGVRADAALKLPAPCPA